MTDAGFNDCILATNGNPNDWIHWFFGIVDVWLTSCVAVSFFFDGLVDIGVLNEERIATEVIMIVSYAGLFLAWVFTFYYNWWIGFFYFYIMVVAICCGSYIAMETVHLFRAKSTKGLVWVAAAAVTGAIGLGAITFPSLDMWLCHHFGCHFGGNFLWFSLTDVAMYCCLMYYVARVEPRTEQKNLQDYKEMKVEELVTYENYKQ